MLWREMTGCKIDVMKEYAIVTWPLKMPITRIRKVIAAVSVRSRRGPKETEMASCSRSASIST